MLKSRLIPCLDVKDGRVVKGVNFVNLRDAGDPVDCAIAYGTPRERTNSAFSISPPVTRTVAYSLMWSKGPPKPASCR